MANPGPLRPEYGPPLPYTLQAGHDATWLVKETGIYKAVEVDKKLRGYAILATSKEIKSRAFQVKVPLESADPDERLNED